MAVKQDANYLTAEQAAKVAGCSATWIRRLLKEGRLAGVQVCGWTWIIDEREVLLLRKNLTSRAVSKRKTNKRR